MVLAGHLHMPSYLKTFTEYPTEISSICFLKTLGIYESESPPCKGLSDLCIEIETKL